MQKFEEKKFDIPKLKGISQKNIEEHLKLYAGYVKNINLIVGKKDNCLCIALIFTFENQQGKISLPIMNLTTNKIK